MHQIVIDQLPPWNYARSEAINMLCTNLSFSGSDVKKILITSSHSGEGKSTTAMDVMRKMAELAHSVVLVDADLRRSMISSTYHLQFPDSQGVGLAHYLAGRASMDDVLYETNVPGAYMVPVGRTVSNPLQLLNSDRFRQLLDYLAQRADCVLIDSAPLGLVIDAAEIAKSCDGTLIVVDYNSVHRRELQDVKNQLEQTGCPILGVALNRVNYNDYMSKRYYYKSYYYSGYNKYDKYESAAEQSGTHQRIDKKAEKRK